jgi:type IV pilus assembly protein PilM
MGMGERIVGLDIGTSALRAVELVVDGDRPPVLEAYGQVGVPPGAIVDGEVRDRSQVAAALRRLWQKGGFKTTRVRLGVAGLRAITREVELPQLPPEEIEAAVRYQAEDIVPFPLERALISSSVVSKTVDSDGKPQLRVLVAAAHRDLIDGMVAAVEEAGLEPEAVDLQSAALSRAFTLPGSSPDPEAVVSVGAALTLVVVHHGGTLEFVRTIDVGGDTITEALSAALDLPMIDAEITKRQLARSEVHDPAAESTVRRVVADLASEVQSSLRYYTSIPGNLAPVQVLVTGGGARTPGLLEELERRMDVPVFEAAPLKLVDASRLRVTTSEAQSINSTVAVPIGLALNGPARTRFDLMPKEVIQRRAENRVRRMLVIAAVGVVLVLLAASAWRVLAVRSAEHDVAVLHSTVHTINAVELPHFDKAVRIADQVTKFQHEEQPLVAKEADWLTVLHQFTQFMPKGSAIQTLMLSAVSQTGGSSASSAPTSTSGSSIGTGTAQVATATLTNVTQFGLAMAKAPALVDVALNGSVGANSSGVTFPISFSINSAAKTQRLSLFDQKIP